MINKRLLIKNLLAHNDENSFYDKKLKLNLSEKEGKAKFLKHICALSNSNPKNNSYIVIGVRDEGNQIVGVDFFDDSKLQNLINAYLENPPVVSYENISFPHLPPNRVVGLVTVHPTNKGICRLRKNIWKYYGGAVFMRDGSISMPKDSTDLPEDVNSGIVKAIENHSHNNIGLTLDGVFDFMNTREDLKPEYKVFKEYFVMCWAGKQKRVKNTTYYSRVDIKLINEQSQIFYSEFDEVIIEMTEDEFVITEYINLGYDGENKYYPFEIKKYHFKESGKYHFDCKLLFEPPIFNPSVIDFLMKKNVNLLLKLQHKETINEKDARGLRDLPKTYLLSYLNGYLDALNQLKQAKPLLKGYDKEVYRIYKDALRVIRKVRYNND